MTGAVIGRFLLELSADTAGTAAEAETMILPVLRDDALSDLLDECLAELQAAAAPVWLDRVTVDLGRVPLTIDTGELRQQAKDAIKAQLAAAIADARSGADRPASGPAMPPLAALAGFLSHGVLHWSKGAPADVAALAEEAAAHDPAGVRALLRAAMADPLQARRLAAHLSPAQAASLSALIAPQAGGLLVRLHRVFIGLHRALPFADRAAPDVLAAANRALLEAGTRLGSVWLSEARVADEFIRSIARNLRLDAAALKSGMAARLRDPRRPPGIADAEAEALLARTGGGIGQGQAAVNGESMRAGSDGTGIAAGSDAGRVPEPAAAADRAMDAAAHFLRTGLPPVTGPDGLAQAADRSMLRRALLAWIAADGQYGSERQSLRQRLEADGAPAAGDLSARLRLLLGQADADRALRRLGYGEAEPPPPAAAHGAQVTPARAAESADGAPLDPAGRDRDLALFWHLMAFGALPWWGRDVIRGSADEWVLAFVSASARRIAGSLRAAPESRRARLVERMAARLAAEPIALIAGGAQAGLHRDAADWLAGADRIHRFLSRRAADFGLEPGAVPAAGQLLHAMAAALLARLFDPHAPALDWAALHGDLIRTAARRLRLPEEALAPDPAAAAAFSAAPSVALSDDGADQARAAPAAERRFGGQDAGRLDGREAVNRFLALPENAPEAAGLAVDLRALLADPVARASLAAQVPVSELDRLGARLGIADGALLPGDVADLDALLAAAAPRGTSPGFVPEAVADVLAGWSDGAAAQADALVPHLRRIMLAFARDEGLDYAPVVRAVAEAVEAAGPGRVRASWRLQTAVRALAETAAADAPVPDATPDAGADDATGEDTGEQLGGDTGKALAFGDGHAPSASPMAGAGGTVRRGEGAVAGAAPPPAGQSAEASAPDAAAPLPDVPRSGEPAASDEPLAGEAVPGEPLPGDGARMRPPDAAAPGETGHLDHADRALIAAAMAGDTAAVATLRALLGAPAYRARLSATIDAAGLDGLTAALSGIRRGVRIGGVLGLGPLVAAAAAADGGAAVAVPAARWRQAVAGAVLRVLAAQPDLPDAPAFLRLVLEGVSAALRLDDGEPAAWVRPVLAAEGAGGVRIAADVRRVLVAMAEGEGAPASPAEAAAFGAALAAAGIGQRTPSEEPVRQPDAPDGTLALLLAGDPATVAAFRAAMAMPSGREPAAAGITPALLDRLSRVLLSWEGAARPSNIAALGPLIARETGTVSPAAWRSIVAGQVLALAAEPGAGTAADRAVLEQVLWRALEAVTADARAVPGLAEGLALMAGGAMAEVPAAIVDALSRIADAAETEGSMAGGRDDAASEALLAADGEREAGGVEESRAAAATFGHLPPDGSGGAAASLHALPNLVQTFIAMPRSAEPFGEVADAVWSGLFADTAETAAQDMVPPQTLRTAARILRQAGYPVEERQGLWAGQTPGADTPDESPAADWSLEALAAALLEKPPTDPPAARSMAMAEKVWHGLAVRAGQATLAAAFPLAQRASLVRALAAAGYPLGRAERDGLGLAGLDAADGTVAADIEPEAEDRRRAPDAWPWRADDESGSDQTRELLFVDNAGVVLLWPFLVHYFDRIGLLTGGKFASEDAAARGVMLIHYMAAATTETEEPQLVLPKLLCGVPFETPVNPRIDLTEMEASVSDELLNVVCQNWPPLRNSSAEALRETFLLREGSLSWLEERIWVLNVAAKPYDMLLGQLPWTLSTFKTPLMQHPMMVQWGQP